MNLAVRAARQFHRVFPFSQLRSAKWILKKNHNKELGPIKFFGYEVPLQARTTVHVLLSIEGERFVDDRFLLERYLRKGMLVMDVVDAKTSKLLWRAYCGDEVKDWKNRHKIVEKVVRKALGRYPPKSK